MIKISATIGIALVALLAGLSSCAIGPVQALTARSESRRILPSRAELVAGSNANSPNNSTDTGLVAVKPVTDFTIEQNAPNPFNASTQITYTIPAKSQVSAEVYDMLGRRVKSFEAATHDPGEYAIKWDGTNETGRDVATGIYVIVITSNDRSLSRKVILLK